MKGFELDEERLRKYFNGEYSEKDEEYVNGIFTDVKKEQALKSFLSNQFNEILA